MKRQRISQNILLNPYWLAIGARNDSGPPGGDYSYVHGLCAFEMISINGNFYA